MTIRAAIEKPAVAARPVLACLDRSRHAADVLAHGLAMAGMLRVPLRVVQALEPPNGADDRPDPLDWAIRRLEAHDTLTRLVAATAGVRAADGIAVEILHGRAADEIRRESLRLGAALVVLGMRGEHAVGEATGLGATAREVLECSACMVLVAPEGAVAGAPRCRRILVPLDGSSWAETALPVAARLARASGARVTLVQVVAEPDPVGASPPEQEDIDLRALLGARDTRSASAHLEQLRRALADQGVAASALTLRAEDARVALSALMARERFDLVVMSSCGHGGARLPDRRCGGVVAHLASSGSAPLLIVKPASAEASRRPLVSPPLSARQPAALPAEPRVAAGADW